MLPLVITATLLGVDSMVVCAALGPTVRAPAGRLRLAAIFGTCDAGAILFAATLGITAPFSGSIGAVAVFAYACMVLLFGTWAPVARGRTMLVLPFALSLDNLAVGASLPLGTAAAQAAISLLVTGGLAWFGLTVGARASRPLRAPAARRAGAMALAASSALLLLV